MVGEQHRLRPLQVGVARHHRLRVAAGQPQQRPLHPPQPGDGAVDGLFGIESEVEGYLVVARAGGMQPSGGLADELIQPPLDVHMQVFQGGVPGKFAVGDFRLDAPQPVGDAGGVLRADDALAGQHPGVGQRPGNILPEKPPVIVNGHGVSAEIGHTPPTIPRPRPTLNSRHTASGFARPGAGTLMVEWRRSSAKPAIVSAGKPRPEFGDGYYPAPNQTYL